MFEGITNTLEVVHAAVAVIIILIYLNALPRLSLVLQKRTAQFFIFALAFFAIFEFVGLARLVGIISEAYEELFKEITESGFLIFLIIAAYLFYRSQRTEVQALEKSANIDKLTGLFNYAYFLRAAQRRFDQASTYNVPLSLIMLDIDNFKAYNDSFGHEAGNVVLHHLGNILKDSLRADDIVARYGGEEFAIVVSENLVNSALTAERIRKFVEEHCSPAGNPRIKRTVTVSLGVAARVPEIDSLESLIETADQRLYRAKALGRNRVVNTK